MVVRPVGDFLGVVLVVDVLLQELLDDVLTRSMVWYGMVIVIEIVIVIVM